MGGMFGGWACLWEVRPFVGIQKVMPAQGVHGAWPTSQSCTPPTPHPPPPPPDVLKQALKKFTNPFIVLAFFCFHPLLPHLISFCLSDLAVASCFVGMTHMEV